MVKECALLEQCGFFKKYKLIKELAFIQLYCRGPKLNECVRKKFNQRHGEQPTDDMMPDGQIIVTSRTS